MADAVPLYQHWQDVYSRRWQIALVSVFAGVVGYLASEIITPVYEANSRFYMMESGKSPLFIAGGQSPNVLLPTPDEKVSSLNIGILRGHDLMQELANGFTEISRSELARIVDFVVSGEFMIDAFVRHHDPVLAAEIANRVPEIYRAFHERSMRERSARTGETLDGHIAKLESELDELRQVRADRLGQVRATDADGLMQERVDEWERLSEVVRSRSTELDSATAARDAIVDALARERELYRPGEQVLTSPEIERLSGLLADLSVELAALSEGPAGPRRQSIEKQIADTSGAIELETQRLLDSTSKPAGSLHENVRRQLIEQTIKIAELKAGVDAARDGLAEIDRELADAAAVSGELAKDESRIQQLEAELTSARQSREEASLQSTHAEPPFVLVSRAHPPERPVFPLPVLNAAVSMVTGAILGVYLALIFAYVERLRRRRILETVQAEHLNPIEWALLRDAAQASRAGG